MVNSVEEFEMRKCLINALKGGRYFITVTDLSEDGKTLNHYHIYKDFPEEDLIGSLSFVALEIEGKLSAKNNTAPGPKPR